MTFEDVFSYYRKITVPQNKVVKISELCNRIFQEKEKEYIHQVDSGKRLERYKAGLIAEAAIEEFLGIDIVDYATGKSSEFKEPDLGNHGLNVGIKCSKFGNFPLVKKNNHSSYEIIMVRDKTNFSDFFICGLATPKIINKYKSDKFVLMPSVLKLGYKTAFYGLDKLLWFKSLSELKEFTNGKNL